MQPTIRMIGHLGIEWVMVTSGKYIPRLELSLFPHSLQNFCYYKPGITGIAKQGKESVEDKKGDEEMLAVPTQ